MKNLEQSVHYLNIAVNLESNNATAMFNLAVIYEELGDKLKAKDLY